MDMKDSYHKGVGLHALPPLTHSLSATALRKWGGKLIALVDSNPEAVVGFQHRGEHVGVFLSLARYRELLAAERFYNIVEGK